MKWRIFGIVVAAVFLVLAAGTGALYAYDSARSDVIAKGVTAGGVDVGGLYATAARDVLERSLNGKIARAVVVEWKDRRWTLEARDVDAHLNVGRMVREALRRSRSGNFVNRAFRDLRGDKVSARIPARVAFSRPKIDRFIHGVATQINLPAASAAIHPDGISLHVTPSHDGLAVQKRFLRYRLKRELRNPDSLHVVLVPTRRLRPHVSLARLAVKYPAFITIDRADFKLRFWKNLQLYKTYTIAVGRQGLETPAGEYEINDKQTNPSWHVPNSSWAGSLAGQVIPPGPKDPLKARWIGITDGAGIHGTDDIGSLGSAASHGCIRMSIPDVIELYNRTPYGSVIFVI